MVDGIRTLDPRNTFITRDGTRYASSLRVPGAGAATYEVNNVPHGALLQIWYPSPSLNMTRRMYVYTPPGYENSNARYPVFFLLHGGGGDEDAWTTMARAPQIFDNLIAQGRSLPMIVVMPNGNWNQAASQDFVSGPAPAMPSSAPESALRFPESIVKDLIPFVDKTYRTIPNRESRAVAGLSMGGAQTWYTAFNHLDQFAWVGSFSCGCTALPGTGVTIPPPPNAASLRGPEITRAIDPVKFTALLPQLNASANSKLRLLYFSVGLDDGETNTHAVLKEILKERGIKYTLMETPGYAHEWSFWRLSLVDFMPRLFQPTSN
jgi:enterochelin esterase family protein